MHDKSVTRPVGRGFASVGGASAAKGRAPTLAAHRAEPKPAAPAVHRVAVAGTTLSVLEWPGESGLPALLLLHGGMGHARWFGPLARALAGRMRVLAPDRRGHGESDWREPAHYGIKRDLQDLEAIAAHFGLAHCLVAGHSQGGLIAVPLVLRGRLSCAGLVLLDVPTDPLAPHLISSGHLLRRIPQIRYPTLEAALERFQPWPTSHRIPPETLDEIGRASFKPLPEGGYTARFDWRRMRDAPAEVPHPFSGFRAQLAALPMPVLAVRAGDSTVLSATDHAAGLGELPNGRGLVVPETTHSLHAERPDVIADAIVGFASEITHHGGALMCRPDKKEAR